MVRNGREENGTIHYAVVDKARAEYGLKPLGELRAAGALKDILTQQKEETVDALSVVARPVDVRKSPFTAWLQRFK